MNDLKPGDVVSGRVLVGGVPLCRDCRWYSPMKPLDSSRSFWKPTWCLLTNDKFHDEALIEAYHSPQWMREYGTCGPSGKLFEPKRPWWRRLFRKGA